MIHQFIPSNYSVLDASNHNIVPKHSIEHGIKCCKCGLYAAVHTTGNKPNYGQMTNGKRRMQPYASRCFHTASHSFVVITVTLGNVLT